MNKILKSTFVLLINFLMSYSVQAQFNAGLRFGGLWTSGNQSAADGFVTYHSWILSYSGGVYSEFDIRENLSVRLGVGFDHRKVSYGNINITVEDKFGYLTVPATLRYHLDDKLSVNAGVQLDILTISKTDLTYFGGPFVLNRSSSTAEFTKKTNYSWIMGLEYTVDKKGVGIRYLHGFLDINDPKAPFGEYKIIGLHAYLTYRIKYVKDGK